MLGEHGAGARLLAAGVAAMLATGMAQGTAQAAPASPADQRGPGTLSAMSLIPWYTSPSLVALRREIDTRWPRRSRVSDGVIGDSRHSRTTNSHNPVGAANGPRVGSRGAVHAMDITASGIDVSRVLAALIGDSRVWYVIHGGKIWSRTTGWAPRATSGDPHTSHIHVNLREDSQSAAVAAERSTRSWFSGKATTAPAYLAAPGSRTSLTTSQVRVLQKNLIKAGFAIPAGATGYYGSQTTTAVAAFQRAQGWRGGDADGIAGPETLRRLGVSATKTASTSYSKATKSTTKKKKVTTTSKATSKQTAGLSKAKTKKLQRKLIKRGYRIPSGPTGWYGPETTRAVKAFQRAQGWRGSGADGIAGAETLRRLGVTKAKTTSSTKKKTTKKKTAKRTSTTASSGASGRTTWNAKDAHLVYDLQGALIAKGYSIPAGQTGYFGPRTKQAVKAFQRAQGWRGSQADGIPGSQTLKRLGL